jgi:hypothetical protein
MYFPALLRIANRVLAAAGTGDPGAGGPSGAGGASSTPTSTETPSTGGTPATSTGDGSTPTAQPTDGIKDGDWRTLRQKYNEAQTKLANYTKLGDDPAKLETSLKTYTGLRTNSWTAAKQLGYQEADFDEAFAADPEKTIQILRQQAAEAQVHGNQPNPDGKKLEDTVRDLVAQQTKPFNEHINRQMTEQAMTRYNNEFTSLVASSPILKDAPSDVVDLVRDYLEERLTHDSQRLEGMKLRGDYAFLKDEVTFVANRLQTVFSNWLTKTQGRAGGGNMPGVRPNGVAKKPTLDDMINEPSVLGDKYKA